MALGLTVRTPTRRDDGTPASLAVHPGTSVSIWEGPGTVWKHHADLQEYRSKRWHTITHQTVNSDNGFYFTVTPQARGWYA